MQIRTALATADDPVRMIAQLATALQVDSLGQPDFLALHFGAAAPAQELQAAARVRFAGAALHGCSSCLGVMSEQAVNIADGAGVGALAIWDRKGHFGTATAPLGQDPAAAARQALTTALQRANRPGEFPDLVWLTGAPRCEEQVLAGLKEIVGPQTLIVGGSAADNDVSGGWRQFDSYACHDDGLAVSVLFTSAVVSSVYHSGYAPTGLSGLVTRASGRRLHEIDNRPAADVYAEWTGGAVSPARGEPESILASSTLWPLGRVTRHVSGVPFYLLAHPAVSHGDGSVEMFADLSQGDRLWQMQGCSDLLVARAGRISQQARDAAEGVLCGALVVFCGGSMLSMQDRMPEVRADIDSALGGVPWLGIFSFGEQGSHAGGAVEHGNLMISCTTFSL